MNTGAGDTFDEIVLDIDLELNTNFTRTTTENDNVNEDEGKFQALNLNGKSVHEEWEKEKDHDMKLFEWWDEFESSHHNDQSQCESQLQSSQEASNCSSHYSEWKSILEHGDLESSKVFSHEGNSDNGFLFYQLEEAEETKGDDTTTRTPDVQQSAASPGHKVQKVSFEHLLGKAEDWVAEKIEEMFLKLAYALEDGGELELRIKARGARGFHRLDPIAQSTSEAKKYTARMIRFPGSNEAEAWRFAVVIRILGFILEALHERKITTKRDIYYKDVGLFRKQTVVDRVVDDIAYTLGVHRSDLNVVAAAKGLVCGSLKIRYRDGQEADCGTGREGLLIPNLRDIERLETNDAKWVLVIEKEATFRALAARDFWKYSSAGKGILITGKGYPDIATRQFIYLLSQRCSHSQNEMPIHVMVDYDPHGVDILACYKYGSASLPHENHSPMVGCVRWLGIKSEDLRILSWGYDERQDQLLRLSEGDRHKAAKMLEKNYMEDEWRAELQRMLFLGVKAEMQLLDERDQLQQFLAAKLCSH